MTGGSDIWPPRPRSNGVRMWYEWEVRVPDEGLTIGVFTAGLKGRVVFVGPLGLFNANEVERLKRPIDEVLG